MPRKHLMTLRQTSLSGKFPATSSLEYGELAYNKVDGKIYAKKSGSNGEEIFTIITTNSETSGTIDLSGSFVLTGSLKLESIDINQGLGDFLVWESGSGELKRRDSVTLAATASYAVSASYAASASSVPIGAGSYWTGSVDGSISRYSDVKITGSLDATGTISSPTASFGNVTGYGVVLIGQSSGKVMHVYSDKDETLGYFEQTDGNKFITPIVAAPVLRVYRNNRDNSDILYTNPAFIIRNHDPETTSSCFNIEVKPYIGSSTTWEVFNVDYWGHTFVSGNLSLSTGSTVDGVDIDIFSSSVAQQIYNLETGSGQWTIELDGSISRNSDVRISGSLYVSSSINMATASIDEGLSDFIVWDSGSGEFKRRTSGADGTSGTAGSGGTSGIDGASGTWTGSDGLNTVFLSDSDRNVGIGITDPHAKLHVSGGGIVIDSGSAGDTRLSIRNSYYSASDNRGDMIVSYYNNNNISWAHGIDDSDGGTFKLTYLAGGIMEQPGEATLNNTLVMAATTSSRVGIGTAIPAETFHVWTNISASNLYAENNINIGNDLSVTGDITSDDLIVTNITASGNINVTGYVSASSFSGDGSGVTGVVSASHALQADNAESSSYSDWSLSSSFAESALTASFAKWGISSSFADQSDNSNTSISASHAVQADSASYADWSISSSFAESTLTASFATWGISSSFADTSISSSYANNYDELWTGSFADGHINRVSDVKITGSLSLNTASIDEGLSDFIVWDSGSGEFKRRTSGADGTSGTAGSGGSSGTSGSGGSSGSSGSGGTSGSGGSSGSSGSGGTSGADGTSGTAGSGGSSGSSGSGGIDGTSGTAGSGGTSGADGTSGVDGTSGSGGTSGADGTSGSSGSGGTSGTAGSGGSSGSGGTSGADGTSGVDGTSGTAGSGGTSGADGTSGVDGTSGTAGSGGTSGADGTSGSGGTSGADGTSGTAGSGGTSGADGTSGTAGSGGSSGTSGVADSLWTGSDGYISRDGDVQITGSLRVSNSGSFAYLDISGDTITTELIDAVSGSFDYISLIPISVDAGLGDFIVWDSGSGELRRRTSGADGTSGTAGSGGTSGADGTSGTAGSGGTSGADGTSGTAGSGGSSGTAGSGGTSGADGTSGSGGTSGADGTSGTAGSGGTSGADGTSGVDGTSGSGGTSGADGTSGSGGTSGADGTSGSGGTSGADGTSGVDGTSGTAGSGGTSGADGTSGTAGSGGTSGADGTSGTAGSGGTSGVDGTSGTAGSGGTSGTAGSGGSSGSGGTSGTTGSGGSSGTSGSGGTSGADGTSGTAGSGGSSGSGGTSGLDAAAAIWTHSGSADGSESWTFLVTGSDQVGIGISGSEIDAKLHVYSTDTGSRVFLVEGQNGALFQVLDELSGSLFAVSDISGLPILEVFDDDKVVAGKFNTNALVVTGSQVGIGTSTPATGGLHVWTNVSASAFFASASIDEGLSDFIVWDSGSGEFKRRTSGADGTSGTAGSGGSSGSSGSGGTSGSGGSSGTAGSGGTSGADGTSGTAGSGGTSGTAGSGGSSGTSGSGGTSGADGTSGTAGSGGTSGADGTSGTAGSGGSSGTAGSGGTSGADGTSGSGGTSGADGTSGTAGSGGSSGSSGSGGTSGSGGSSGIDAAASTWTGSDGLNTVFLVNVGDYVGIGTTTPTAALDVVGDVHVSGTLFADAKSFDVGHPTKPNYRLRYGSLEGPEYAVYLRGEVEGNIIELPNYWDNLIDEETITVDITPIGRHQKLYVYEATNKRIEIRNKSLFSKKKPHYYFIVYAERKDIQKLNVEYKK